MTLPVTDGAWTLSRPQHPTSHTAQVIHAVYADKATGREFAAYVILDDDGVEVAVCDKLFELNDLLELSGGNNIGKDVAGSFFVPWEDIDYDFGRGDRVLLAVHPQDPKDFGIYLIHPAANGEKSPEPLVSIMVDENGVGVDIFNPEIKGALAIENDFTSWDEIAASAKPKRYLPAT